MSGGSYNYAYSHIENAADELRARHQREPHVMALAAHLYDIAKVMHHIEWADSCDTSWTDALDAEIRAVVTPDRELSHALNLAMQAHKALGDAIALATTSAGGTDA